MVARTQRSAGRTRAWGPGRARGNARNRGSAAKGDAGGALALLGRAGFLARGIMYIVIGWIALQIVFDRSRRQADQTGALHELGSTPVGAVALWILVVGFFGLALWWFAQAAWPSSAQGRKAVKRVVAVVKGVIYAVLGYGTLRYAIGAGAPQSSDKQSVDLTATAMHHAGGKALVVAAGLALIGGGLYLGYQAWREKFRKDMELGRLRPQARNAVEWLGRIGGIARSIVFIVTGVFLVVAAVQSQPGQAKGVDSALRELAATPAGPWLLVLVALGLIMFGMFSCCEARLRRF